MGWWPNVAICLGLHRFFSPSTSHTTQVITSAGYDASLTQVPSSNLINDPTVARASQDFIAFGNRCVDSRIAGASKPRLAECLVPITTSRRIIPRLYTWADGGPWEHVRNSMPPISLLATHWECFFILQWVESRGLPEFKGPVRCNPMSLSGCMGASQDTWAWDLHEWQSP